MIIEIDDKLVSTEIFKEKFVCDLNACKGECCIAGDAGAPLTEEEVSIIEDNLENILPFMRAEGITEVEKNGVFYMDWDQEPVTTLVNEKECAFVTFDEKNIAKCSIEDAYNSGKIDFKKPISCHLYPIRTKKFEKFEALNYNEWSICNDACTLGQSLNVPVFQFLKEPLERKYGESFYKELVKTAEQLKKLD